MRIDWQRRRTVICLSAYLAGTVAFVVTAGIPTERDVLAVWLLLGLLVFSLSDLQDYVRGLVRDWLPFFAVLIAYDALRGTAGKLVGVHFAPQIAIDRWLFGGTVPSVALQRALWHGHVVWYDDIAWCVYMSHFFAAPVLAAILWKLDRARFRWFAVRLITLSLAALATYALYPAAPPWMASQRHLIGPVTRIIPIVLAHLDLHSAGSVIEGGYSYANNVAAVPSVHAAYSLLIAITLWPYVRRALRPLLLLYPLAMAFTLVYTGEHYVSDVLLGWLYTGATLAGIVLVRSGWSRWHGSLAPDGAQPLATPAGS